jgi:ABC-2 type transport system permease protein
MMGELLTALSVEWLKARRSKVPVLTAAVFTAAAAFGALFMVIVRDPDRAQRMGLLNQKAQLSGLTADWAGLLGFLSQVIAVGGLLVFAFIATWVFGREFSDGTFRYLLALPVSRSVIAYAKFVLVAVWSLAITGWLVALVFVLGWVLRLPGWTTPVAVGGAVDALTAASLMLPSVAPVALVACWGRGYLAPLASALGALALAQVAAVLGWGSVVPWSIPAIAAGLAPGSELGPASLVVSLVTGVAGVAGTVAWWRTKDAGL